MIDIEKLMEDSKIYLDDEEKDLIHSYIRDTLDTLVEIEDMVIKEDQMLYIEHLREDEPTESLPVEDVFKNTNNKKYSYFDVGKIGGHDE